MIGIYGKIALVVGASSGVGKVCANYLVNKGYTVYGTSRKASFEQIEGKIKMIPLDVTNEDSIKKAVQYIEEKEGAIHVLINCPGYGLAGSVEDITTEEAKELFNTNFFGIMSCCREVLPMMRKQRNGLIINISSVAGFISIPYQSMYSSSKYALEAMTEALRIEVKPFNVRVSMIAPGDMKTNFERVHARNSINSVYKEKCDKAVNEMIKSESKGPSADVVVKELKKIINKKNPSIRRVVGWQYKLVGLLKRLLPAKVVEYVISKIY
ncbi:SDR family NAD(P)-dependent oxidoreductase [Mycoplasmatota bacterium]|nr:SDR family NAD(P)-dependent oxidoreductase [Mycoplasmatota bacterium]